MQQRKLDTRDMTYDEVSVERSKSFVKALQELKNLRPQLYSAAEYCERSYLHNEQKQMVLDNLKDYAVRALVNAVDHLGTVAYKLTDLFEQQTLDLSNAEQKISCLNQQILTSQIYTDKEALGQQQLWAIVPRYHKHYVLPNFINKKAYNMQLQTDAGRNHMQAKPRPHQPGTPASKTLSWLLASEANSTLDTTPNATLGNGDSKSHKRPSEVFQLQDAGKAIEPFAITHRQSAPTSNTTPHAFGAKDHLEFSEPFSAFSTFNNPTRREIYRPTVRSKNSLVAFFAKNKYAKQRKASVS